MGKKNLTDRKVKSLKRTRSIGDKLGHYDTWDTVVRGLGVRTSSTGRRTFVLMARYPGDRDPARRKLGVYGEARPWSRAREKARDWLERFARASTRPVAEEETRQAAPRGFRRTPLPRWLTDYLRLEVIGPDPEKPRQRTGGGGRAGLPGVFIAPVG